MHDAPTYGDALLLLARSAGGGKAQAQVALERASGAPGATTATTGSRGCWMAAPNAELGRFRRFAEGVRLGDVEEHITALCSRFDVEMVAFDKHLFIGSAQWLAEAGAPMVEFPQKNSRMVPATQLLHEVIADRRLRHGGDPTARSHALAAVVGETEMGIRLRKTASRDRIDALVALAIGIAVADAMPAPRRSVYESRFADDPNRPLERWVTVASVTCAGGISLRAIGRCPP